MSNFRYVSNGAGGLVLAPATDSETEPVPEPKTQTVNEPRPFGALVESGCLVSYRYQSQRRLGVVQGINRSQDRAYVRPLIKLASCVPMALSDLTLVMTPEQMENL